MQRIDRSGGFFGHENGSGRSSRARDTHGVRDIEASISRHPAKIHFFCAAQYTNKWISSRRSIDKKKYKKVSFIGGCESVEVIYDISRA